MKVRSRAVVGVLLACVLATVVWYWPRDTGQAATLAASPSKVTAKAPPLTAASVLSIDVSVPSAPSRAYRQTAAPLLTQEFDRQQNLKTLYERLSALGANATPDAKYVLYQILSACSSPPDAPGNRQRANQERRRKLAASLSDSNAEKQKRLAALDSLISRCDGMETVTATSADLKRLLEEAAREGDPKAKAHIVARDILESLAPSGNAPSTNSPSVSDSQLAALRESLQSRDPSAILIAGTALSNTFRDLVVEVGENGNQLDGRAAVEAWRLLACEYGLECGALNRQLRSACANAGQCGAATLPDYTFYYGVTPSQSQLVDYYRQLFRASIESNDWSQIRFVRRENDSPYRFMFSVPQYQ